MLQRFFAFSIILMISGCATYAPSLPENYSGPTALVEDSAKVHSNSKADFFVVNEVDGAEIDNSMGETFRRNYGRGMSMTPYYLNRRIVAEKPLKLTVLGRTVYAAPILAFTNKVYQIKGVVEFVPKANVNYIVRGELSQSHSSVWVEEVADNSIVGNKIEVHGSTELGFFVK